MRTSTYKDMKLRIYQENAEGKITDEQRNKALLLLEQKKEDTEMTPDRAKDLLDEMGEKFPSLEDDCDKLAEKIDKAEDEGEKEDKKDDDSAEDGEGGEEVSEAAKDLFDMIASL